ncbi:hypothetical protein MKJ04_16020 [Pontibacter sp. E15-1]|uniref:hypothetical protein n=1 Tax=Pontibacter sp. E15-1 TaxID=2919918 RepID=UPI001F4FF277|nr:hypothetical protein [Pontibacter sp. E15-1]MCJ8166354.1 hypothetical protein [Pontibacter sp. E15-1]
MRRFFVMLSMLFGSTFAVKATGTKLPTRPAGDKATKTMAGARAKQLSNHMITGLQLNNYQSRKTLEINTRVAEQLTDIELQNAGNAAEIERLSQNVYAERDRLMEDVLSTVQYNHYFGNRKNYQALDREIAANIDLTTPETLAGDATAFN